MTTEAESIRALAREVDETVVLTQEFYSCVVKDLRRRSSDGFKAVDLASVVTIDPPPEDPEET
jgi:hypothetical protein